jgi:uncharacterized protein (DUF2336 family)
MAAVGSVIAELESAIKSGSAEKRVDTLRRITGLFLDEADRLNEQQIGVFDDVLVHLIERIETKALVQLSSSLAPVDKAPFAVIRRLAYHDEIMVAGPVLTQSNRISDNDLVQIARSKSQSHLYAMSGRASLSEAVTDVLVERGDSQVTHRLAKNAGARFSDTGFDKLVTNAEVDEGLAEKLGLRLDMPLAMLRRLLQKASDAVRARLLATAPPENQEQIQRALASVVSEVSREAGATRDFKRSDSLVLELNRKGQLKEATLLQFAMDRKYEEMASTLALFCQTPVDAVELLLKNPRNDGVILACKAARLSWPTASAILHARSPEVKISEEELREAKDSFLELTQAVAQRTLRFMIVQLKTKAS